MMCAKGQRYGMICFGSRLDVYLPDDVEIKVTVGDKVKAGSSLIYRTIPNGSINAIGGQIN